jgi:uncharacterized membrane protein
MRARLLKLIDTLFRNFWFLPGLMMICAIGIFLLADAFNDTHWVYVLQQNGIFYSGGLNEAKTILQVIAETMVAIASLAFATVGVVLTLATSQFGHRLIRSFMRDKPTQFCFGIFVSTFIYSLLVLYELHKDKAHINIPALSVSVAFFLAIVAGAVLIYFTNHIAQMISAPSVIAEVGGEMDETIDRTWPEEPPRLARFLTEEKIDTALERIKREGLSVQSGKQGYIQTLDAVDLLEFATEQEVIIKMDCRPGDYLYIGNPVALVWPADKKGAKWTNKIHKSMVVGKRRTPIQDLRFAFNQLAEIEVRAMSPALNDPFTALDCVNRICAGISRLAQRTEPTSWKTDSDGHLRLFIKSVSFDELLNAAFMPMRNYSRKSAIVTLQMLHALNELAPSLQTDEQRQAIAFQAGLILDGANEGLLEGHDRDAAQSAYQKVLQNLNISPEDLQQGKSN